MPSYLHVIRRSLQFTVRLGSSIAHMHDARAHQLFRSVKHSADGAWRDERGEDEVQNGLKGTNKEKA